MKLFLIIEILLEGVQTPLEPYQTIPLKCSPSPFFVVAAFRWLHDYHIYLAFLAIFMTVERKVREAVSLSIMKVRLLSFPPLACPGRTVFVFLSDNLTPSSVDEPESAELCNRGHHYLEEPTSIILSPSLSCSFSLRVEAIVTAAAHFFHYPFKNGLPPLFSPSSVLFFFTFLFKYFSPT